MVLMLSADGLNVMKWWPDSAFAIHRDMRSHTGGTMMLGHGSVFSCSTKQKLVTKSSTEAKIVSGGSRLCDQQHCDVPRQPERLSP
eukprot:5767537-Ditylum_brightwellii.AAC.1